MASNYLVTLMVLVEEIYGRMGLTREEAIRAFWPLVKGNDRKYRKQGHDCVADGTDREGRRGNHPKTCPRIPEALSRHC